ncbi:hypothetical protein [Mycolicibacterium fortuitum]|uniref:hypothetical protein n=1 Tax=Mycolicibacterium fortuitum TaxID=1766 RepID=UPI00096CA12D|nr:hypothetical protein [Mycolicibacterium fortuitum]OMC07081.1 hypothetical protein A5734_03740 [Mycolicibacterium fortuitum]
MPRPINHDDERCALCDHLGIQHHLPERGGPCEHVEPDHQFPGWGRVCDCPGFELPPDDDEETNPYE